MRRWSWVLVSCFVFGGLAAAAPAGAESGHKDKDRGDAPAAIDITGISANNALRRVQIRLDVPGLTTEGVFTLTYESARYDGMAIEVRREGAGTATKAFHCGEDSCTRAACAGIKVRWNESAGFVAASIPQSCYPLRVPDAWNFNGHSDLGKGYDSTYTRLRLSRG